MRITAISEGNALRILRSSEPVRPGTELELFTADEIERLAAGRLWESVPAASREQLLAHTRSAAWQAWLAEKVWDEPSVATGPCLPLAQFKP